jgi:hypothetical protein
MANRNLTREAAEAIIAEKHWTWTTPDPGIPAELIVPIALEKAPCPICHDKPRHIYHRPVRGDDTGIEATFSGDCICPDLHRAGYVWKKIPAHFEDTPLLRFLKPTNNPKLLLSTPVEVQQRIIDCVKKLHDKNLMLTGSVNGGKSWIAFSLWKSRVLHNIKQEHKDNFPNFGACWAVNVREVLDQQYRYTMTKGERPTVDADKIRAAARAGWRPTLLLDEIDKFSVTPARLDFLFDICAATYDSDGQLISTSNLTVDQLAEKWKSDTGDALLSRLADRENGRVIDFDAEIAKWQLEQAAA